MFDVSKADIPRHPGIYIMKDPAGHIIYIGKAKDLRKRVRSYFSRTQDYKTARMVKSIGDIEFVLTDTENEAYILESSMIKRHRPKFNIELKDQERYTYLRITDEKYPRLVVARRSATKARTQARHILATHHPAYLDPLTDAKIRERYNILLPPERMRAAG